MQTYNIVRLAQHLLWPLAMHASCLVDATAGKGLDTMFLADNASPKASIWAFDIQQAALAAAQERLCGHKAFAQINFINDSHANIGSYLTRVDVAMFNLGYLPGYDHSICTRAATTVAAIRALLPLLSVHGLISIASYAGHETGQIEQAALQEMLQKLPCDIYTVGAWSMLNHQGDAPRLYLIEKVRSE